MTNREIALFPAFLDQLFIVCYISYCVVTNGNIIERLGFVLAMWCSPNLFVHIVFEWLLINCCVVITGQPTTRSNESIVGTEAIVWLPKSKAKTTAWTFNDLIVMPAIWSMPCNACWLCICWLVIISKAECARSIRKFSWDLSADMWFWCWCWVVISFSFSISVHVFSCFSFCAMLKLTLMFLQDLEMDSYEWSMFYV